MHAPSWRGRHSCILHLVYRSHDEVHMVRADVLGAPGCQNVVPIISGSGRRLGNYFWVSQGPELFANAFIGVGYMCVAK